MALPLRGERFHIPLSSESDEETEGVPASLPSGVGVDSVTTSSFDHFVKDIKERPLGGLREPAPPTVKANVEKSGNGFPAHRKRISKFKSARGTYGTEATRNASRGAQEASSTPSVHGAQTRRDSDEAREDSAVRLRREIDEENRARIAGMTEEEVEHERKELLSMLSPSLVGRLMARSSDDTENSATEDTPKQSAEGEISEPYGDLRSTSTLEEEHRTLRKTKRVTFSNENDDYGDVDQVATTSTNNNPSEPTSLPSSIHFPSAPQPPSLDPSSDSFLTELHDKYFPSLPHDPSKLAWMQNQEHEEVHGRYDESDTLQGNTGDASRLRFDLRGRMLHPRPSRGADEDAHASAQGHKHAEHDHAQHHHGTFSHSTNPGHTLLELAQLSRSTIPTQRCIAYQTLGRLLYRLGRGEFGRLNTTNPSEPARPRVVSTSLEYRNLDEDGGEFARGLWRELEKGRVMETLEEEASRDGAGHLSARAYAVEALWLWRRGREENENGKGSGK